MGKLAILVMKVMIKRAKTHKNKLEGGILKSAYDNMIKSYESALIFLEANN